MSLSVLLNKISKDTLYVMSISSINVSSISRPNTAFLSRIHEICALAAETYFDEVDLRNSRGVVVIKEIL